MDYPPNDIPDQSEGTPAAGARRTVARDSLLLTAEVRFPGVDGEQQVRIRNLSAGGLMAELPHPVEVGVAVEVHVRGLDWVHGRIAWVAAGRVGIAFDQAVDPMAARKPVVKTARRKLDKPIRPLL